MQLSLERFYLLAQQAVLLNHVLGLFGDLIEALLQLTDGALQLLDLLFLFRDLPVGLSKLFLRAGGLVLLLAQLLFSLVSSTFLHLSLLLLELVEDLLLQPYLLLVLLDGLFGLFAAGLDVLDAVLQSLHLAEKLFVLHDELVVLILVLEHLPVEHWPQPLLYFGVGVLLHVLLELRERAL